jgi:hypothetical protein
LTKFVAATAANRLQQKAVLGGCGASESPLIAIEPGVALAAIRFG